MAPSLSLALAALALVSSFTPATLAQVNISQSYAPVGGECPSGFELLRSAGAPGSQNLNSDEKSYTSNRRSQVLPAAWKAYLSNVQNKGVQLPSYVSQIVNNGTLPNLGIATSGGGYRAAIFGAGVLNALDGRNQTSVSSGVGGLLQSATYFAGLSGGSWLLTSLYQANFPTIENLAFGPPGGPSDPTQWGGWNAELDLLEPYNSTAANLPFLLEAITETTGKLAAGFPITMTDVWGRLLARHFLNGTNPNNYFGTNDTTHGAGELFSALTNVSAFANFEVPFPIVSANANSPSGNRSAELSGDFEPLTNVIYEFTPYEMGSYDPMLATFTPTKYLGTINSSHCITGFDQSSFIIGSSAELFNEYNTSASDLLHSSIGPLFTLLNVSVPEHNVELDVALYPNPFFGVNNGSYIDSNQNFLELVDGGEDGEVVPFQPLLVKARGVDTIIAIDATSDTETYASGSSLIATQDRVAQLSSAYSFPKVPTDTSDFVSENLVQRPTFFGCDDSYPTPLVIYIANGPGALPAGSPAPLNTSTSQFTFELDTLQEMIDEVSSLVARDQDKDWPACLACAVVDRQRASLGVQRSGVCNDCFNSYCWRGKALGNSASSLLPSNARMGALMVALITIAALVL